MGFLSRRRPPCPICGGEVKGLLPWRIAGQTICKTCAGHIDLPDGALSEMTMEAFLAYRAFREENGLLRQRFRETQRVEFAWYTMEKILFDMDHGLFCLSDQVDRSTIFEREHIKSFTVYEDDKPLFEGSAAGLVCYNSTVQAYIEEAAPRIQEWANASEDEYVPSVSEPIDQFLIEIQLEHPYWKHKKVEMKGPRFDHIYPRAEDYLDEYQAWVNRFDRMAHTWMELAFPDAPEQRMDQPVPLMGTRASVFDRSVDVMEEIRKAKALLEQGLLTEEEFAARKRELLGI